MGATRWEELYPGPQLLDRFGDVEKTPFFNILVMRSADLGGLLDPSGSWPAGTRRPWRPWRGSCRYPTVHTFQSRQEFERKACQVVHGWLPQRLARASMSGRHRRGFRGKLSSMDEERFLDGYLLKAWSIPAPSPHHLR